jgi:prepilin signal peptidase PulO-like enzyme (type II secretory pathway)
MVELLGALLVLPLLYYFLYKLSNEQWVGSGDWILCIPLALVLGNFWLAFFCLFTSNLLGCLAAIPTLTKKHKTPQHKIHFGPFLILGFLVVFLSQNLIYQLFYFY